MINFFSQSIRELAHVVWPSRVETRRYFLLVIAILIAFGVYLYIVSFIFSKTNLALRSVVKSEFSSLQKPPVGPEYINDVSFFTGALETGSWNVSGGEEWTGTGNLQKNADEDFNTGTGVNLNTELNEEEGSSKESEQGVEETPDESLRESSSSQLEESSSQAEEKDQ